MKQKIKTNLENLFNQNIKLIKDASFQDILDGLLENNHEVYDLNTGTTRRLYDEEGIKILEELKQNQNLIELFASARDNLNADYQIVEGFKRDILHSIETIKEIVQEENKGFKNQIIFIEHDYKPYACFCGFGAGEYPVLETPKYIKFNFHEELFNGVGKISYENFWKKRIEFDEQIEALNLADLLWDSAVYQGLINAYKFKTNLLLYEAFEQIPIESFAGIPVIFPLFIFANEHDCEAMNVFVYE